MSEQEDIVNSLLQQIDAKRQSGKNLLYLINYKIADEYVDYVSRTLGYLSYSVETKKCFQCFGSWDIIIKW